MAAQRIDYSNPLETAYWCGVFSCDEKALIRASLDLGSCEVAAVGVYLAEYPPQRAAHRITRDESEPGPTTA